MKSLIKGKLDKNLLSKKINERKLNARMLKNPATAGDFWSDESAVGVVEVILILVVLVILIIIFKDELTDLVNSIFSSINSKSESVYK